MKTALAFTSVLLSAASAMPQLKSRDTCTPATYQCHFDDSINLWTWQVCNTSSQWVTGGNCLPSEKCEFNTANGSPYCVPDDGPEPECQPDQYQCVNEPGQLSIIKVCEEGKWVAKVTCEEGKICRYGAVNGYPWCVDEDYTP